MSKFELEKKLWDLEIGQKWIYEGYLVTVTVTDHHNHPHNFHSFQQIATKFVEHVYHVLHEGVFSHFFLIRNEKPKKGN